MNENDYNSNFKIKVSRSLTDLQNSLDEACRLGLPPNLGVQIHDTNDEYFSQFPGFNFKNDLTYKSASYNLEKFISDHEEQFKLNYHPKKRNVNEQINNSSVIGNRKIYIDTLRMLATHKPAIPRSISYDGLVSSSPGDSRSFVRARESAKTNSKSPTPKEMTGKNRVQINLADEGQLESEIEQLRSQLAEMSREMKRIKNGSQDLDSRHRQQSDTETSVSLNRATLEFQGREEPYDKLHRRLDRCKVREAELIQQLGDAIHTIEQAKLEEMQAVLRAEQLKEECDNMKIRFNKMVEENQKRLTEQADSNEIQTLELTCQLREELQVARTELAQRHGIYLALEDQLRSAKSEIDQLNEKLEQNQLEKCSTNDDIHTALTQALLRRNEVISANSRLQGVLDRERSNYVQEKSIWQEEITELQKRLHSCENAQLNINDEKIRIINENNDLKSQLHRFTHMKRSDEKRNKDEQECLLRSKDSHISKLQMELQRKQIYFESVLTEAQQAMHRQISLINKFKHNLGLNVQDMDCFVDRHRDELSDVLHKLDECTSELHEQQNQNRDLRTTLEEYSTSMEDMRTTLHGLQLTRDQQNQEIIARLESTNKLMRLVEMLTVQLQDIHRRVPDCSCGAFDPSDVISAKTLQDIFAIDY